jgi:hypothetical protein
MSQGMRRGTLARIEAGASRRGSRTDQRSSRTASSVAAVITCAVSRDLNGVPGFELHPPEVQWHNQFVRHARSLSLVLLAHSPGWSVAENWIPSPCLELLHEPPVLSGGIKRIPGWR